jgi:hypothetical protein
LKRTKRKKRQLKQQENEKIMEEKNNEVQKESEKPQTATERLGLEYDFILKPDISDSQVVHIEFKDGRRYKFQHPPFFTAHKIIMEQDEHDVFIFALSNLFPENEKSPIINEKYLNANRDEGFYLWSPLARGLLSGN